MLESDFSLEKQKVGMNINMPTINIIRFALLFIAPKLQNNFEEAKISP
jgi:hypothetical protein